MKHKKWQKDYKLWPNHGHNVEHTAFMGFYLGTYLISIDKILELWEDI